MVDVRFLILTGWFYQAEQLLGGTKKRRSTHILIYGHFRGKHWETWNNFQTPERMFGIQHGHPGRISKIVKQHADKRLDSNFRATVCILTV